MEYQDPGAADATSNQEGTSVDENGDGVKAGTAHQSLPQLASPVSVTAISDLSDVLCTHNYPTEYCHDHQHYPVFVPPPAGEHIARNILQHVQEAHKVGIGPIVGYRIGNDDSDKENNPNATAVPPQSQGQGLGSCDRHRGRQGRDRQGVRAAKEGPIRLYHPWQTHSIGVQAGRSTSPVPRSFKPNHSPGTSPSSSPTTRDKMSLPNILQFI